MGTCGAFFNSKRSMYNLKIYPSNIYVVNYGDAVANHGSVYRPCLNYQKEEWVGHYTHKSTSLTTGNRMFQWLQKLVPLKHLSSEHMIYVQKSKIAMRNWNF